MMKFSWTTGEIYGLGINHFINQYSITSGYVEYYTFTCSVGDRDPIQLRDELIEFDGKRSIFDLDKMICEDQIKVALDRADRAFESNSAIANTWGIEVLIHLVGDHQIKNCLDIAGITQKTRRIGIIQDSQNLALEDTEPGMDIPNPSKALLDMYGLASDDPCKDVISKGVAVIIDHE